jgi:hypothetical protein
MLQRGRRLFKPVFEAFVHERSGVADPLAQPVHDFELDLDSLTDAEAVTRLAERVVQFLITPDSPLGVPALWGVAAAAAKVVIDKLPAGAWDGWVHKAIVRKSETKKPVVHMRRPGCAQLFFIFGGADIGNQDRETSAQSLEFLRQCGLFGRNLTFIRDPHLEDFQHGISTEYPDVPRVAAFLKETVDSLPYVRDVHAIGYSSGCYGALLFGHLCRMKSVWAFNPRTARARSARETMENLKTLMAHHNGVTEYQVWFSENKVDRQNAEIFDGTLGLTLHPYAEAGEDHGLIVHLALKGILRTLLPPFEAAEAVQTPGGSVERTT